MYRLYALLFALSLTTMTATASTHTAKQMVKYTIKKGDTLSSIAHKHHTTIAKVRKTNGLKKGAVLRIGKVLNVPTNGKVLYTKTSEKPVKYVTKKGDTLSSIALKHHTSVTKIRKANALRKSQILKIGKVLHIPQTQKTYKVVKVKQPTSDKKLVASLSRLDTISLEKEKKETPKTFSFTDIFTNKKDKDDDKCQRITSLAKTKLGKKYVWGASGNKNTYDCSSFTKFVYKNIGIDIPRTSIRQSKFGKFVKRSELQKGDLIFFDTSKKRRGYVNHVGIYLGDNKFIHASSAKKKVVITSLDKKFYSNRYKGARRPS
ncbi:NlpC/P60 family protein [Sulfurovum sp. XTW-4]|uniref:NlpC/P60 family protein n=1 Tax=Sulfurovum xiamenensis TaxID=3019066 RepID=A0ABT7QSP4_9BACT|nr:C40 family peptidase [Sulfurovum xiamenensis]MDM5264099.1 NlpC/P60 family protein [Sulfurovum xiamenensis]